MCLNPVTLTCIGFCSPSIFSFPSLAFQWHDICSEETLEVKTWPVLALTDLIGWLTAQRESLLSVLWNTCPPGKLLAFVWLTLLLMIC